MQKENLSNGRAANDFVGKPIYSLDDGRMIEHVKHVIYDSKTKQLLGFSIERRGLIAPEVFFLPFENIIGIGRDAITVQSKDAFRVASEVPQLQEITSAGKQLASKTVLTRGGNDLGSISDVLIDPKTGRAVSYEVSGGIAKDVQRGRTYVPVEEAGLVGMDAIIVPDSVEQMLEEQEPGGITGAYKGARAKTGEYAGQVAGYTQQQEIALSLGKVAGYDVYDDAGLLIVGKDQIITEDIINHAVAAGKMHQVALSAGVGTAAAAGAAGYTGAQQQVAGMDLGTRMQTWWIGVKLWFSDLMHLTRRAEDQTADEMSRTAQKRFLTGRISATDVQDMQGLVILHEGDVITPLILDVLDKQGLLTMVRIRPQAPVVEGTGALHLVVEDNEAHERHRVRPHI